MDAGLLLVLALGVVPSAGIWAYRAFTRPRRGPWTDTDRNQKGGAS